MTLLKSTLSVNDGKEWKEQCEQNFLQVTDNGLMVVRNIVPLKSKCDRYMNDERLELWTNQCWHYPNARMGSGVRN